MAFDTLFAEFPLIRSAEVPLRRIEPSDWTRSMPSIATRPSFATAPAGPGIIVPRWPT
jgi:hypothetical protein